MKTTRSLRRAGQAGGGRRSWLTVLAGVASLAVSLPVSLTAQIAGVTPASADFAPVNSVPQVIPKPVSMTVGQTSSSSSATREGCRTTQTARAMHSPSRPVVSRWRRSRRTGRSE
jgi:hypothetical protein